MTVHKPHLVVVGSVAIDWIITPRAERPESVGGSATFFAMAASYLSQVRLVGVVGRDFPDYAVADLKAAGVDVSGLEVVQDGLTFRWKGQYHENMNDRTTLETHLNVFEKFQPRLPAEFRGSEYLFLANIQPRLQSDVFAQMQRPRLVGLDTMNLWISIANDDLKAVLKNVDVLTLNDEEARQLSGEHNIVKAARAVRALGPRNLVIKRGEYGALLFDADGEVFSAPALPLEEVVDPTGAGDSFAGGFMGYLARPGVEPSGASLRTAMIYGSVMASFCVEGFSYDRLKGLDAATIQKRFETFASLTNFARASLT
ncbi:Sugar or nucleoside kinase, ribokinase family [Nannocystis exedens]|uniref:Sugar or nucleoside kinase, ribokinase family n=1 Tax=Nannocystis exedens TaxID=54 RepID=A0A1I2FZX7_9BACT|nr:PfkB family carbohydrate kinase [Nannocystis exedens]PCC74611.1 sugar kinase [Nannocystis exedens]SFF10882.1 Sugar or nucleoside kinase, ribokinase family [Nannocystis exedens]